MLSYWQNSSYKGGQQWEEYHAGIITNVRAKLIARRTRRAGIRAGSSRVLCVRGETQPAYEQKIVSCRSLCDYYTGGDGRFHQGNVNLVRRSAPGLPVIVRKLLIRFRSQQEAYRAAIHVRSTMDRTASVPKAANRVAAHGLNDWLPNRWTHRNTIAHHVIKRSMIQGNWNSSTVLSCEKKRTSALLKGNWAQLFLSDFTQVVLLGQ